jgi:hypothetical protein
MPSSGISVRPSGSGITSATSANKAAAIRRPRAWAVGAPKPGFTIRRETTLEHCDHGPDFSRLRGLGPSTCRPEEACQGASRRVHHGGEFPMTTHGYRRAGFGKRGEAVAAPPGAPHRSNSAKGRLGGRDSRFPESRLSISARNIGKLEGLSLSLVNGGTHGLAMRGAGRPSLEEIGMAHFYTTMQSPVGYSSWSQATTVSRPFCGRTTTRSACVAALRSRVRTTRF